MVELQAIFEAELTKLMNEKNGCDDVVQSSVVPG